MNTFSDFIDYILDKYFIKYVVENFKEKNFEFLNNDDFLFKTFGAEKEKNAKKSKSYFKVYIEELKNVTTLDQLAVLVRDFSVNMKKRNKKVFDGNDKFIDKVLDCNTAEADLVKEISTNFKIFKKTILLYISKIQIEELNRILQVAIVYLIQLKNKLGSDTLISEVLNEDIVYLTNLEIKRITRSLWTWCEKNIKYKEYFKTELEILDNNTFTIREKIEKADIINNFFSNVIGREFGDGPDQDPNLLDLKSRSKLNSFRKGRLWAQELKYFIVLANIVIDNFDDYKNDQK